MGADPINIEAQSARANYTAADIAKAWAAGFRAGVPASMLLMAVGISVSNGNKPILAAWITAQFFLTRAYSHFAAEKAVTKDLTVERNDVKPSRDIPNPSAPSGHDPQP